MLRVAVATQTTDARLQSKHSASRWRCHADAGGSGGGRGSGQHRVAGATVCRQRRASAPPRSNRALEARRAATAFVNADASERQRERPRTRCPLCAIFAHASQHTPDEPERNCRQLWAMATTAIFSVLINKKEGTRGGM